MPPTPEPPKPRPSASDRRPAPDDDALALVAAARAAAANAHAPYSGFAVGAALRLTGGGVITGCNVENASFGLSLCAETVAVAAAAAAGRLRDIAAIAVAGGRQDAEGAITGDAPVTPCGRCRQVLMEASMVAGRPLIVYCAPARGTAYVAHRLDDLLPHAFGPADLAAPAPNKES